MNDLLRSLFDGLKQSSVASKLTAGIAALAVVLAVGISAFVSNRPHFGVLLQGLDDGQAAAAMKALAEADIPFETSQPPGPFVVYVDEDDRRIAFAAIYQSGARIPLQKGIPSGESGMSSVFMSSGERLQMSQKRLWGEMEGLLEGLDFVAQATVQTSTSVPSPFARTPARRTAAVQLQIKNQAPLTDDQAKTVVMLVSSGLEVLPADIVLSDQTGRMLNGAPEKESPLEGVDDWLEYKERYDLNLASKANRVLSDILGPFKARVEVDSLWSFEQSTTASDTFTKGAIRAETKNTSETPIGGVPHGIAGASSNVDFGVANAAVPDATVAAAVPPVEPAVTPVSTTSEARTEYDPSRSRTETVNTAPVLKRLSVALFLDDSVSAEAVLDLEGAVKAAVGYDADVRTDNIKTVRLPFAGDEPVVEGEEPAAVAGEPAAEPAAEPAEDGPSPMMQMLMRRGVEVLTALVFIVLLLKSLRTARKEETGVKTRTAEVGAPELDPELLAQAQVEELLTSDPKRVGEILSQWAREAEKAGAAA
jgi:flagellar M-ring protein FliF